MICRLPRIERKTGCSAIPAEVHSGDHRATMNAPLINHSALSCTDHAQLRYSRRSISYMDNLMFCAMARIGVEGSALFVMLEFFCGCFRR